MISIKQLMSEDHNHCDELLIEAENNVLNKNWSAAETALNNFTNATLDHFRHEETVLFPAFEQATGMSAGPTEMMRHEHEQLRQIINDLRKALADQHKDSYLSTSETLFIFIRQHNMKEEQMLYNMMDQHLTVDFSHWKRKFDDWDQI